MGWCRRSSSAFDAPHLISRGPVAELLGLEPQAAGGYRVDHVVRGDTNAEVLQAMEHSPELLLERLRLSSEEAIGRGQLKISEASRLMAHLEASLGQSTYLQS